MVYGYSVQLECRLVQIFCFGFTVSFKNPYVEGRWDRQNSWIHFFCIEVYLLKPPDNYSHSLQTVCLKDLMCTCLCSILVLKSDANRECSWRAIEFPCHPVWQPKTAIHATGERCCHELELMLRLSSMVSVTVWSLTLVISDFYNVVILSHLTFLTHVILMTLIACYTYQNLAKSNLFSHCASLITEFKTCGGTRMKVANLAGVIRWLLVCYEFVHEHNLIVSYVGFFGVAYYT